MEIIILQSVMTVANLICAAWIYKTENYKVAMLNGFSAGVCFMVLLNALQR